MTTPLDNLETTWVDHPKQDWLEDLESMIEGYPFEQQRYPGDPENLSEIVRDIPPGNNHALAAHFGDKLVGWIEIDKDDLLSEHLPVDVHETRRELVQRNRDDVRQHLISALGERYPDDLIEFQQPSQNRTARSFLQNQPTIWFDRIVNILGKNSSKTNDRHFNNLSKTQGDSRVNPNSSDPKNLEIKSPLVREILNSDEQQNYLDDLRSIHENQSGQLFVKEASFGSIVVLVDRESALETEPGTIQGNRHTVRIHSRKFDEDAIRSIMRRIEKTVLANEDDLIEVWIDADNHRLFDQLLGLGYTARTKRMFFYRIPESLLGRLPHTKQTAHES